MFPLDCICRSITTTFLPGRDLDSINREQQEDESCKATDLAGLR